MTASAQVEQPNLTFEVDVTRRGNHCLVITGFEAIHNVIVAQHGLPIVLPHAEVKAHVAIALLPVI